MKPVNARSQTVLERLTRELATVGAHRRYDRSPGVYVPLSVECIGPNQYSLAHYIEMNGDLVADPEMVFWRAPATGEFFPLYLRQVLGESTSATVTEDGTGWLAADRRLQVQHAAFADMWLRNIARQQLAGDT